MLGVSGLRNEVRNQTLFDQLPTRMPQALRDWTNRLQIIETPYWDTGLLTLLCGLPGNCSWFAGRSNCSIRGRVAELLEKNISVGLKPRIKRHPWWVNDGSPVNINGPASIDDNSLLAPN